ncbi:MAG: AbiV family abortive infection protein [Pseudomonadota bacterium]
MGKPQEDKFHEDALSNARRQHRDAQIMLRSGRYESATTHAIVALEELGKSLIAQWNVRNEGSKRLNPSHVEKQSAAFAILAAHQICVDVATQRIIERIDRSGEPKDLKSLGKYCEQFAHARAGFYENLRMSLTYADKEPVFPRSSLTSKVTSGLADEIISYFNDAIVAMGNDQAHYIASTIYKNNLGRW